MLYRQKTPSNEICDNKIIDHYYTYMQIIEKFVFLLITGIQ